MTCHDGFTLYDLVSYDRKHNEANGEDNHDGRDDNFSWNSGVEGPTEDQEINRLREQRARNFVALVLLSQGVPMLLAGDEVLRTQQGNNNAYCQDNDLSWQRWSQGAAGDSMLRFTREMIALRKRHSALRRTRFFGADQERGGDIQWSGEGLGPPDWNASDTKVLCFTIAGAHADDAALHVMLNMSPDVKTLPLPAVAPLRWMRVSIRRGWSRRISIRTARSVTGADYRLPANGIAVFEARQPL